MVDGIQLTPEQVSDLLASVSTLSKQVAQLTNDLEAEKVKSQTPQALPQVGAEDTREIAMHTLSRLRASKEYQALARGNKVNDAVELAINFVLKDYEVNPPNFRR